MEARWLTVGPVQENTWIARQDGSDKALLIDPGDEPDKLLEALEELGTTPEAILITHCHFDHVGAVKADGAKPPARRSTAPRARSSSSRTSTTTCAFPGFGPFESYTPEHTVKDGDKLQLAGFEIDVIGTPGHSPDHVTYSIAAEKAIFSGDVLFQGSIGRTDLPGCDHADADGLASRSCWTRCPTTPASCPGHMDPTTLGQERRVQPVPASDSPAGEQVPDAAAARTTCCPTTRPNATGWKRPRRRSSSARATAGSRRRPSRPRELFARGVGEATDVVQKEMFTFGDEERVVHAAPGGHGADRPRLRSSTACTSCRSR